MVKVRVISGRAPAGTMVAVAVAKAAGKGKRPTALGPVPADVARSVDAVARSASFTGEKGSKVVGHVGAGKKVRPLLLFGAGEKEKADLNMLRALGAAAVGAARETKAKTVAAYGRLDGAALDAQAQALAEGAVLGGYKYDLKQPPKEGKKEALPRELLLAVAKKEVSAASSGAARGARIAESVNLCRDLGNRAGAEMHPEIFAAHVRDLAKGLKNAKVTIMDTAALRKKGMNAIISVGQGSANPPCLLVVEVNPGAKGKPVVLVGKGVVFDSGGISIKPAESMELMRYDKCGAAAVSAAALHLASEGVKSRVVALAPLVENLPSGTAYKPGDFVKTYSGKTLEIVNTDAEGRVILCDALAYGAEMEPRALIDLATLTGACMIALGDQAAGLFGTDRALMESVKKSAEATGERVWELPLYDEYLKSTKSDFADLKNSGGRYGGASMGAIFLREFTKGAPWVHLDIAPVAWNNEPKPWGGKGASGYGVRLLIDLVRSLDTTDLKKG
jgi:leucyl aminopeptidase